MTKKQKTTLVILGVVLLVLLGAAVYGIDVSQRSQKALAEYQVTLGALYYNATQTAAAPR